MRPSWAGPENIRASNILKARRSRGLSQRQLAVRMGDHARQMISRIEHGQSTTSVESLCAAARVLDVSADYLYGLTDDPTPSVALARDLANARANRLRRTGRGR